MSTELDNIINQKYSYDLYDEINDIINLYKNNIKKNEIRLKKLYDKLERAERYKRSLYHYHLLCDKEIDIYPTTEKEYYYALVNSAISFTIPEAKISNKLILQQVSRHGSTIFKYLDKYILSEEVITAAVFQDPSIVNRMPIITEEMVAISLVALPETFDSISELPDEFLIHVITKFKFDNYDFMIHFSETFINSTLINNPNLYMKYPSCIKEDKRVISKILSHIVTQEMVFGQAMNPALSFELLLQCGKKKGKKITKTLRKLFK